MKDCARGIVLLLLPTDRHEASRDLYATAELLVATLLHLLAYFCPFFPFFLLAHCLLYLFAFLANINKYKCRDNNVDDKSLRAQAGAMIHT